jgi:hypothetical protein
MASKRCPRDVKYAVALILVIRAATVPTRWQAPRPDKGRPPAATGGSPNFCYLMLLGPPCWPTGNVLASRHIRWRMTASLRAIALRVPIGTWGTRPAHRLHPTFPRDRHAGRSRGEGRVDKVAGTLQSLGAEIRDVRLPSLEEFAAVNRVILQSETWAVHGPWLRERPGDFGQLARRRLMAGAFISAGDYVQASRRRLQMIAAVEDALREGDVLLCASAMEPPCRIDKADEVERSYPRQARYAVQCDRASSARNDGGDFGGRFAAVGAIRRSLLR